MTRVSAFSSPLLLGFEEIERALERLSKAAGDGYPPYNIERLKRAGDRPNLRITLAVAGFTEDGLDVSVEEDELVVRGKQRKRSRRANICTAASPRDSSRRPSSSPRASR